ncbi:MAG: CsgG/HfaB family protein [candidate division KSB1 bacterium]|nr:CsgG/HfaB family protein [candidate division KSB1 bacterium]
MKPYPRLFCLTLLLCITASGLSHAQQSKTAAIFPFHFASLDANERDTMQQLNELFYDLFAGQLTSSGYFEVVDRQHIDDLMQEINFQQSGLTADQAVEIGKARGAELALFGTVTQVYKQTFLTLKIIDIETTLILKAVKVKGSLKKIDDLAMDAGYRFMHGLSSVLYDRYGIGAGELGEASQEGIERFLTARDQMRQAIVAKENGDSKKARSLQDKAKQHLEYIIATHPELKSSVSIYVKRLTREMDDERP